MQKTQHTFMLRSYKGRRSTFYISKMILFVAVFEANNFMDFHKIITLSFTSFKLLCNVRKRLGFKIYVGLCVCALCVFVSMCVCVCYLREQQLQQKNEITIRAYLH